MLTSACTPLQRHLSSRQLHSDWSNIWSTNVRYFLVLVLLLFIMNCLWGLQKVSRCSGMEPVCILIFHILDLKALLFYVLASWNRVFQRCHLLFWNQASCSRFAVQIIYVWTIQLRFRRDLHLSSSENFLFVIDLLGWILEHSHCS